MADDVTLPGTGAVVATDDVGGRQFQLVKLAVGGDGVAVQADAANPVPVGVQGTVPVSGTFWQATQPVSGPLTDAQMRATPVVTEESTTGTHYQPGFDVGSGVGAGGPLRTDPDGNLVARAQVLTDELGYRANFANTSLAVSIGTATFTNGSRIVTGSGFIAADMRSDDYCKLNADAESAWMQIESLDSDTQITLIAPYTGTGGTGASSRAILKPVTGSGGAISVASGVCTMTSGTTINAITEVERDVDWLPLVKMSGVAVSQRIVNQGVYVGFYDELAPTAPKWFAWFLLDGTVNTTVKCQSGRNPTGAPSAAETEETVVTLPNGATTATSRRYRAEVLGDRVNFLIDGVLVATHYRSMPGPGDLLTSTVRILNGAVAPASSTTVTVDFDTVKNHNKLEVGLLSDAEQVVAAQPPAQMFSYTAGAVVIPINTDIMVIDCSQLRHLSVHLAAIGTTGVVTPAWSNDGTNWLTATMLNEAGATSTTIAAPGAALRTTPVRARYFRLRMTTATTAAGSTSIIVAGLQQDIAPVITTQPVSGSVTVSGTVPATVTGGTTLPVTPTQSFINSAATTNATAVKASAGTVWSIIHPPA